MNELYRKIPCSDRMPEKDGLYITDKGVAHFHIKTQHFNIWEYPIYWLEPIQLPADEEISAWLISHKKKRPGNVVYLTGCIDGFKSALELLTGGKK